MPRSVDVATDTQAHARFPVPRAAHKQEINLHGFRGFRRTHRRLERVRMSAVADATLDLVLDDVFRMSAGLRRVTVARLAVPRFLFLMALRLTTARESVPTCPLGPANLDIA